MAIRQKIVTVGTSPTPLSFAVSAAQTETDRTAGASFLVRAVDGSSTFYVGGADVSATQASTQGWPVTGGQPFGMDIDWQEIPYGVVASGTTDVYLIMQGV